MSIGRANVGVVAYSNRLYAVGGFSGKKFLDTFEYLDAKSEEW
jgi:influenza virus NS1A-binding protein